MQKNMFKEYSIKYDKKFHKKQLAEYFTTQDMHILQNILETYSACISALKYEVKSVSYPLSV